MSTIRFISRILAATTIALMATTMACTRPAEHVQPILPIYSYLDHYRTLDSAEAWHVPDSLVRAVDAFMAVVGYEQVTPDELCNWSYSLPVKVFTPAVDSVFPSLEPVEKQLGGILAKAAEQRLALPDWEYAAVVWGRRESIVFADSVMLIALNHYLGEQYDGYEGFPIYLRVLKTPEMLPYDMAEAMVATAYPFSPAKPEPALTWMLRHGILTEAKMRLTDGNLAMALGYSPEALEWLNEHERELWTALVSRNLLYDTSTSTADRLLAPAPTTSIITTYSPGRAGRYLGYRIIQAYLKKHPTELARLLSPTFLDDPVAVLQDASYNP